MVKCRVKDYDEVVGPVGTGAEGGQSMNSQHEYVG